MAAAGKMCLIGIGYSRFVHIAFHDAPFAEAVDDGDAQNAETVDHAAPEINARGFFEIAGRAGDLGDLIALIDDLRQHLIVENEIFVVTFVIDVLKDLAGEGAIARMVFGEFLPKQDVFEKGECAVEDVFIEGHATVKGALAEGSGAQDTLVDIVGDEPRH